MSRPRKRKPGKTESLGDRIRRFRLAKGLTQTELGQQIGVSQRVVTYYEVRGISPPPELVVKIADVLGVSIDALFGRKTALPKRSTEPIADNLRRLRRLKRLEELPPNDQMYILKMIDAMADRSGRRKAS
jgi:transcriptional regulator with XRE-family HTH domain